MTIKVKGSWGMCSISVQGIDMNCPLCGVLVRSGENHHCSKDSGPKVTVEAALPKKRKRREKVDV